MWVKASFGAAGCSRVSLVPAFSESGAFVLQREQGCTNRLLTCLTLEAYMSWKDVEVTVGVNVSMNVRASCAVNEPPCQAWPQQYLW